MSLLTDQAREQALEPLRALGWVEDKDRDAITKSYKFRNFAQAFGWMASAAILAEKVDHHPEWSNVYNRVTVTLTTHSAGGLTDKDTALAHKLEEIL